MFPDMEGQSQKEAHIKTPKEGSVTLLSVQYCVFFDFGLQMMSQLKAGHSSSTTPSLLLLTAELHNKCQCLSCKAQVKRPKRQTNPCLSFCLDKDLSRKSLHFVFLPEVFICTWAPISTSVVYIVCLNHSHFNFWIKWLFLVLFEWLFCDLQKYSQTGRCWTDFLPHHSRVAN